MPIISRTPSDIPSTSIPTAFESLPAGTLIPWKIDGSNQSDNVDVFATGMKNRGGLYEMASNFIMKSSCMTDFSVQGSGEFILSCC